MFYGTIFANSLYLKSFISKPIFFLLGTSPKFGNLKMNVITIERKKRGKSLWSNAINSQ